MLNTAQCERGKKFSIYFVASLEYFPRYYLRQKTHKYWILSREYSYNLSPKKFRFFNQIICVTIIKLGL